LIATALTGYSVDLSGRFQKLSNYDTLGCNFTSYRIDKVVEKATLTEISHTSLYNLDPTTGILKITNFDSAYQEYQLFISASNNGGMWSNSSTDGYLVQISMIDSRIVMPKGAPTFVNDLEEVKLLKGD
jgi:hypothetical protein